MASKKVWYRAVKYPGQVRVLFNEVGDKCCVWGHDTPDAAYQCGGKGLGLCVVACTPGDGTTIEYRRPLNLEEQASIQGWNP